MRPGAYRHHSGDPMTPTTETISRGQRELYEYRVETAADEAARWQARAANLADERDTYREWFQASLHALHRLTAQCDRQRDTIAALRDERRYSSASVHQRRAA